MGNGTDVIQHVLTPLNLTHLPTASESPLVYACELWVFAMCPALRGSTVSYAGDAHFPKHSLEYSLNFWSQSKKKKLPGVPLLGFAPWGAGGEGTSTYRPTGLASVGAQQCKGHPSGML